MTGLVRNAAATVALMLVASAAFAGVPSATTSSLSSNRINLVGYNLSATDAANSADSASTLAKLTVTVRDLGGNPVAGSNVVIDFSGATSDLKIASTQFYHGETVGCAGATVSNYSNAAGVVTFSVIGGKTGTTAHTVGSVKVYADGVLLSSIGAGTYDYTNTGGLTLIDLSGWAGDYFGGLNPDRADIDGNGTVTLIDMSNWASAYFGGRQSASAATSCP